MQVQALVPIYQSAADFTAKTGRPCPPCNPTAQYKAWEDATLSPGMSGNYTVVVAGQYVPLAIQVTIPYAIASRVNLPTAPVVYPAYSVPATDATENGQPANPENFCIEADAQMLVASVAASGVVSNLSYRLANNSESGPVTPGADGRKVWILTGNDAVGNQITDFVGVDIAKMYKFGVGCPGTWSIDVDTPGVAELAWTEAAHQSTGMISPAAGSTPIPIVPLPAGATLAATSMSMFDPMQAQIVLPVPPASSGPSQMELYLLEILAMLKAAGINPPTV